MTDCVLQTIFRCLEKLMVELVLVVLFAAGMLACLFLTGTVIPALLAGFVLFLVYGVAKGRGLSRMLSAAVSGVRPALGVLVILLLVGMLTATWRASGTMAFMAQQVVGACSAPLVLLASFLLCCAVSFLVGSAFGTAATVGAICIVAADAAQIPVLFSGGAVLSGAYFGDRCSPVSGSALLVASLTKTKAAKNMKAMFKTSLVPLFATCAIFGAIGWVYAADAGAVVPPAYLASSYHLSLATIVPALVVLMCALCGMKSYLVLAIGTVLGGVVAVLVQGCSPADVLLACAFGYAPAIGDAQLLAGGGICSMLAAMAIITVSSSYAGMFEESGFLKGAQAALEKVASRFGSFAAVASASVFAGAIACNQTLGIVLTHQLCKASVPNGDELAVHMESAIVLMAALVPWSTAAAVPLAAIGAPELCILTSFYVYLVPLWNAVVAAVSRRVCGRATAAGLPVVGRA